MRRSIGFTLFELMVVVGVLGVLFGIAALNVRPLGNDAGNAASEIAANLRLMRARAVSTTSAYRAVYESEGRYRAEYARRCDDAAGWTVDPGLALELREGVAITAVARDHAGVIVCFDSRGAPDANAVFELQDRRGAQRTVELFLGGSVTVHD